MKRTTKKDNIVGLYFVLVRGRLDDDRNINRITSFLFVVGKINVHAVAILVAVAC
jgi:hypothetical protein